MSEIREYRGQRVNTNEWVYGMPVGDVMICGHDIRWLDEEVSMSQTYEFDHVKVIPETIGQYSGKDDKNSVRIFEDDIVKLGNNPIHNGVLVRCIYADWRCGFVYEFLTGKNKGKFTDMNDSWRDYERIGNIYDNPKLLEVEE